MGDGVGTTAEVGGVAGLAGGLPVSVGVDTVVGVWVGVCAPHPARGTARATASSRTMFATIRARPFKRALEASLTLDFHLAFAKYTWNPKQAFPLSWECTNTGLPGQTTDLRDSRPKCTTPK